MKSPVRGAIKEGQNGGQNSGDAGGSHSTPATSSPIASSPSPEAKRTYTAAEKTACSIEAMRNGEICEACQ